MCGVVATFGLDELVVEEYPELAGRCRCASELTCTQLAATSDGIVAYDPVADTLTGLGHAGATVRDVVELSEPIADRAPYLVAVGPGDIAYFLISHPARRIRWSIWSPSRRGRTPER